MFKNQLYREAKAYTLHDTALVSATLQGVTGVSVNASGTVVMELEGQSTAVTVQLTQGVIYPLSVRRLKTGGSATGITVWA